MSASVSGANSGAIDAALDRIINQTSGSGTAGNAEEPRSALVFTSRLRQALLKDRHKKDAQARRDYNNAILRIGNATALEDRNLLVSASTEKILADKQISDISKQVRRSMPDIVMEVNPNNIEFVQPKRFSRVDTLRGSVFHHFSNNKGQNNDILTIKFSGNTGNISRRGRTQEDKDRSILRFIIWHNLYQLTREPMLLTDGQPNMFEIQYVSAMLPTTITFRGFFNEVLNWSENGQKPNSKDYSFSFIVQETFPDIDTIMDSVLDYVLQYANVTNPSDTATILST